LAILDYREFLRAAKEFNTSDESSAELRKRLRPRLSPAMQENWDEMERAYGWGLFFDTVNEARHDLGSAYNEWMGTNGFSPASKFGEAYADWVKATMRYYRKKGVSPTFFKEWDEMIDKGYLSINDCIDYRQ
jgi:hypothetical protein